MQLHTIVAVSTPAPACGGLSVRDLPRSIIRLSGPQAPALLGKVLTCDGLSAAQGRAWRRVTGQVRWRTHTLPAVAYVMPAPRSYTREEVVELHLQAVPWLLSSLLDQFICAGARLAQPGEFTRRAFLNGRLSLSQAEAVGALINSGSADEARAHAARLQTHARQHGADLRAQIEELLALIEFGLDFEHDEAGMLAPAEIQHRLCALRDSAQRLANPPASDTQSDVSLGLPRVVLAGPTNAGKSSLFNALLARDAALVSAQRHTTRDYVEARTEWCGEEPAVLVDTAGALAPAECGDCFRLSAWNATVSRLKSADVLLLAIDSSLALDQQPELQGLYSTLSQLKPAAVALVWTKRDLPQALSLAEQRQFAQSAGLPIDSSFSVSAVSGAGIGELQAFLAQQATRIATRIRTAAVAAATTARQSAAKAALALSRAADASQSGAGAEIVALDLREALNCFWQAEGILIRHDAITEAMLDRIFSRFCVGK